MDFTITTQDYIVYLHTVLDVLNHNRDYISRLDAATGDGDHWANLHSGFQKLKVQSQEWSTLSLGDLFQKCALVLMSEVGGSSGVLYGSAYLEASKVVKEMNALHLKELCLVLDAMCRAVMERGQTKPGFKTMVDAIYPAVETYKKGLAEHVQANKLLPLISHSALEGAENTKNMSAVKGRASYRTDKGVGHIDPGAVTMAYQICTLMECASAHLSEG